MRSAAIALAILVLVGLGCRTDGRNGSSASPEESRTGRSAEAEGTKDGPVSGATAESTPIAFKTLDFSASAVTRDLAYEGRITDGAKWADANGENTLLVTERKQVRGQDDSVHFIYGYLYAERDGSTRLLWKIQDSAENYCDNGKGLTSPIDVRDIDGDGVAENMFVYNIAGGCDVSPIPYKLLMHSGEKKLAIRGTNSVEVPDYRERGAKNFDAAFNSSPPEFRKAAADFWDRYVAPLRAN